MKEIFVIKQKGKKKLQLEHSNVTAGQRKLYLKIKENC